MKNGDKLKQWRERCDLNQVQMARYIGIPLRTYEKWERGEGGLTSAAAALVKVIQTMEAMHPETMNARRQMAREVRT